MTTTAATTMEPWQITEEKVRAVVQRKEVPGLIYASILKEGKVVYKKAA